MNYYPHHIGDFNNATRHLTRVERSIYRDMIELYYDTEQPLTADIKALCRKLLARTEEESTAVEQVLNEFFTKTEQGWYHSRCEEVMQEYRDNISAKSAAGRASAAKREAERLAKLNSSSTAVEQPLESVDSSVQLTKNQEPRTSNQEPKPSSKTKATAQLSVALPDWIPAKPWVGYLEMRKKKRKEPTARAIELLVDELGKLRADGQDIGAVLDKSTVNGWTDVYAIKPDANARASPARTPLDLAAQQKAANDEAKRRLFGNDDGRTIDAQ